MKRITLIYVLAFAACGNGTETKQSRSPVESQTIASPGSAVPAVRVNEMRNLLMARHEGDLPSRETLLADEQAIAILRELADYDRLLLVRARALSLLGHFAEQADFLSARAGRGDIAPQVRAGAISGLGRYDLAHNAPLRARVVAGLGDADARIAYAAVQALRAVPGARVLLEQVAVESKHAVVRDAASQAISEQGDWSR